MNVSRKYMSTAARKYIEIIDQVSKVDLDSNKTDKLNEHVFSIQINTKMTSLLISILRR